MYLYITITLSPLQSAKGRKAQKTREKLIFFRKKNDGSFLLVSQKLKFPRQCLDFYRKTKKKKWRLAQNKKEKLMFIHGKNDGSFSL